MKKMITCVMLSTVVLVGSTYAIDPGSKDDPLVTKSYVDDKISDLEKGGADLSALQEQIDAQGQLIDMLLTQVGTGDEAPTTTNAYEIVTIPAGGTLIGEQGTEMILRGGQANVMGSHNGGIQDVTDGVDLQHGQTAPKFHLMIIPRTEGRGLFAETEIIVMVRGGYTIQ